jgi:hypothetical protein
MNRKERTTLEGSLGRKLTRLESAAVIPVPTKLDQWMQRNGWSNGRLAAEMVRFDPRNGRAGVCERTVARLRAGANLPTIEVGLLISAVTGGDVRLTDMVDPALRSAVQNARI